MNITKRRILFINGHLNTGGVERSLVDVLQHIDYKRYDVDLLLLQGKGDYAAEIPAEVRLHDYDTDKAYGPFLSTALKLFFRGNFWHLWYRLIIQFFGYQRLAWAMPELRRHYDTAIAYRPGICTHILAFEIKSSNKISWWHHGEMNLGKEEQERLYAEYRQLHHIVTVSESSAYLVKHYFPEESEKVIVIPNMLCIDTILHKASLGSAYSFSSGADRLHIVSVGRLSPEKNMRLCIRVAQLLRERSIPFEWILVGDGDERDLIRMDIDRFGFGDEIRMVGSLSNPYPLMKTADILFHPSLVESQGLTILEAMALGTPVVCVRSAGPSEFIHQGVNGVMIQNDEKEASEAIIRLYQDAAFRKAVAERALATIDDYNPAHIINKIEQCFSPQSKQS